MTDKGNELEAAGSETVTFTGAGSMAFTWHEKLREPGAAVGPVDWAWHSIPNANAQAARARHTEVRIFMYLVSATRAGNFTAPVRKISAVN